MALPSSAVQHYQQQQAIAVTAAEEARSQWGGMGADFDASWAAIGPAVTETVTAAQVAAASTGSVYVGAVLAEQGIDAPAVAPLRPLSFAGRTSEGNELDRLLVGAVYAAKTAVGAGLSRRAALAGGAQVLEVAVLDSVRFANRQAVSAAITARPGVGGWVRMLNPPSCKFCTILAGKWFEWNQGFQSHDNCDCRHIPTQESLAGAYTVNPRAYFETLDTRMQDRVFGKKDAQAIRDGADPAQVVNIRSRGFGRVARKRGWKSVDEIYAEATDRDDAIRLLAENGYIAPPL